METIENIRNNIFSVQKLAHWLQIKNWENADY